MVGRLFPNPFSKLYRVFNTRPTRISEADHALSHTLRSLATPALVSFSYYIGTIVKMTPAGTPISTFWPPNAILLASLLLVPRRMWLVVLVAVLPAHLAAQLRSGIPLAESLGWFVGNAGEALLGAALITAFKKRGPLFDTAHGLVVFFVFGGLLAPLLTSFVDAGVFIQAGGRGYWLLGATRLFSNILAALTIVPTIVIFASKNGSSIKSSHRVVESLLLAFGVISVSFLTFGGAPAAGEFGLVYAPLPFLLWAAVRFGLGGLSASLLGISLISIWNTVHARGLFTSASIATNVLFLEISLCIIAAPLMLLATVMTERRATEESLRRSQTALQRRLVLERSISELSRCPISISAEQLKHEIEKGLQHTLQAAGADRLCWYQVRPDGSELERLYSAKAPRAPSSSTAIPTDRIPYTAEKLAQGEPVIFPSLEDLPSGEIIDRATSNDTSPSSLMFIPSVCGTRNKGVLEVTLSKTDDWLSDSVSQLTLLANLIATTLERHEAEREKLESEQRFQALFREFPIGIALEDVDGQLVFANPALCSMLRYSEEELRSKSWSDFTDPEDSEEDRLYFQSLLAGSITGHHLEKCYRRKDGIQIWGHRSVSLMRTHSRLRPLVIGMVQDITERKAVEAGLRQRDTDLQKLTLGLMQAQEHERQRISRELHDDIGQRLSLLTIGLTRLGQELPVSISDKQTRLFDLVNDADELSSDVHTLSHQLHSSTLQHLGLTAALKALCKKTQRQYDVAIKLETEGADDVPSDVALCFFRVAQEALSNAVSHGGAKQISLRLHEHDRLLRLQVRDSGSGFDISSSPQGLGLVTMRERLRMLGGSLLVKSAKGLGTEVTAELHLAA